MFPFVWPNDLQLKVKQGEQILSALFPLTRQVVFCYHFASLAAILQLANEHFQTSSFYPPSSESGPSTQYLAAPAFHASLASAANAATQYLSWQSLGVDATDALLSLALAQGDQPSVMAEGGFVCVYRIAVRAAACQNR